MSEFSLLPFCSELSYVSLIKDQLMLPLFFFFSGLDIYLHLKKFFLMEYMDLQCCVSFKRTASWLCYTYTCIHSFLDSFTLPLLRWPSPTMGLLAPCTHCHIPTLALSTSYHIDSLRGFISSRDMCYHSETHWIAAQCLDQGILRELCSKPIP